MAKTFNDNNILLTQMKQNAMVNTSIVILKWWKSSKCKRNKIFIILIQCTVVVVHGSDFRFNVKSNLWSAAVAP